jgi:acetoin utilization protein AcuB
MLEEHAAEHAAFWRRIEASRHDIAANIEELSDELDAHMAAEERTFLSPLILRADEIARFMSARPGGTMDAPDMAMLMPTMSQYMTRQPWTVRKDAKMSQAHELMRSHRIRHLPVLDAGKLVGIVSDRDLHLIETLPDSDPDDITVEEAMTENAYVVGPDDPVDTVVERMAAHKYGCAIVANRRGFVEGIFTTVDAMQVLAEVLRRATA